MSVMLLKELLDVVDDDQWLNVFMANWAFGGLPANVRNDLRPVLGKRVISVVAVESHFQVYLDMEECE